MLHHASLRDPFASESQKSDSAQAENETKPLRKMKRAPLFSGLLCLAFTSSISVLLRLLFDSDTAALLSQTERGF